MLIEAKNFSNLICGYCNDDSLFVLRQRADPMSYIVKAPQINLCGAFA